MLGVLFTSIGNFKRIVRSPTMADRTTDDNIFKKLSLRFHYSNKRLLDGPHSAS